MSISAPPPTIATLTASLEATTDPGERARLLAQLESLAATERSDARTAALDRIAEDLLMTLARDLAIPNRPFDPAAAYNELDFHIRSTRGFPSLTRRQRGRLPRADRIDLPISHLDPDTGETFRQGTRGAPRAFVQAARKEDWDSRDAWGDQLDAGVGPREQRLMDAAIAWREANGDAVPSGAGDDRLLELRRAFPRVRVAAA